MHLHACDAQHITKCDMEKSQHEWVNLLLLGHVYSRHNKPLDLLGTAIQVATC